MNRPFLLGLTGSIGMGKSTTAQMFADEGIPVWDADDVVHALYAVGGPAVDPIRKLCPEAIVDGAVDRAGLKKWIRNDPGALDKIESVVHPLVANNRQEFIDLAASHGADLILLDIPLLFEKGTDKDMDATLVVSAPADAQRERVLSRPGMTEEQLNMILSRQMPDAKKRLRADYVIETLTLEQTRRTVQKLISEIRENNA